MLLLAKAGLQKAKQLILSVGSFMAGLIRIAQPTNEVIEVNQP